MVFAVGVILSIIVLTSNLSYAGADGVDNARINRILVQASLDDRSGDVKIVTTDNKTYSFHLTGGNALSRTTQLAEEIKKSSRVDIFFPGAPTGNAITATGYYIYTFWRR
ncbi:MAG: hypothetical protein HYW85_05055 [Deltaproteobacteria bacterium]|nr:hypothetical protein [Deltaproteobacteria bacterium]